MAAAFPETPNTSRQVTLPEDQSVCVRVLMTLDQGAMLLKQEKINSSTQLLVATFAFKVLNRFGGGMTQRKIQEMYDV